MADQADVFILATLETKNEACSFLIAKLQGYGIKAEIVDLSLNAAGVILDGAGKIAAMAASAARALSSLEARMKRHTGVVVAFGGGTGSQIALQVLRQLPFGCPKFLVTTLPFDPRPEAVYTDIVFVPSISDIMGMNATLRTILETVAAMVAGAARMLPRAAANGPRGAALTAMGVTTPGIDQTVASLREAGIESTVFHAVGFGGFALENWLARGEFSGLVDFTPHEITRILFGQSASGSRGRFEKVAELGLPQVLVPGGLNLHCLGPIETVSSAYLSRPRYKHSAAYTHVVLSAEEMRQCVQFLAGYLNQSTGPIRVIVPLGGFSTEDRPGGAIESPELRAIFVEEMRARLKRKDSIIEVNRHLNDPAFTALVAAAYLDLVPRQVPA